MKRLLLWVLILALFPASGLAGTDKNDRPMTPPSGVMSFSFSTTSFYFPTKITADVYTGPGTNYFRAGDGHRSFISQEFKYGGRVGDWLFVRCMTKTGIRYGYIYAGEYSSRIKSVPTLNFSHADAVIKRNTGLWDSILDAEAGTIGILQAGTHVTYLGSYVEGGMVVGYVETTLSGQKARGFVTLSALEIHAQSSSQSASGQAAQQNEVVQAWKCSNCGNINELSWAYCTKCGNAKN